MKLKSIKPEEIETLQFSDLAYMVLKEKGHKMKIADLFKVICELKHLSKEEYESEIADFFTLLATEKRFVQLENGFWDLRENHITKLENVEDDTDDEESIEEINNYQQDIKDLDKEDSEKGLEDLILEDDIEDDI